MKDRMIRVDTNFSNLVKDWSRESGLSQRQVTGVLAKKMTGMKFYPEKQLFSEPGLFDLWGQKKPRGKKGSVSDVLWFVGAFFLAAVTAIILTYTLGEYNSEVQGMSDVSADAKTPLNNFTNQYPQAMDSGLVFAYISVHIGIIMLGLFLRTYPVVFPILMLAVLLLSMLAGYISNAYNDDIASDSELNSAANLFPKTSWLLDNYVIVTLAFGFLDVLLFSMLGTLLSPGGGGV